MKKHRVKTHNWVNGVLQMRDFLFDSFDDASEFIKGKKHHSAKIYNEEGILITHISDKLPEDSYA